MTKNSWHSSQLRGFQNFTFELASYLGKLSWPGDKIKSVEEARRTTNQQVHVTKTQLGVGATRIADFQRKVKTEFEKPVNERIPWLNKIEPPLDQWLNKVKVLSIICDPVKNGFW